MTLIYTTASFLQGFWGIWQLSHLPFHQSWRYSCQVRGHEAPNDLERVTRAAQGPDSVTSSSARTPTGPTGIFRALPLQAPLGKGPSAPIPTPSPKSRQSLNSAKRSNLNSPWFLSRWRENNLEEYGEAFRQRRWGQPPKSVFFPKSDL